jgi:hypothetical protein
MVLDSFPEGRKKSREASAEGAYVLTHCAELSRSDGGDIPTAELKELLRAVQAWLSFIRGFWVAPLLAVGVDQYERRVWEEVGVRRMGRMQAAESWFPPHEVGSLQPAFEKFFAKWADLATRKYLDAALYWYLEANSPSGGTEVRLISAVVALEAVISLLRVSGFSTEFPTGSPRFIDELTALLSLLDVSSAIPPDYDDLRHFAETVGAQSGPGAVWALRNATAHPSVSTLASVENTKGLTNRYWQAWYLAMWYVELGLLRAIGYQGKYASRIGTQRWLGDSEPVPWTSADTSEGGVAETDLPAL